MRRDDWYRIAVLLWIVGSIIGVWGVHNVYVDGVFYMMIFPHWLLGTLTILVGFICCAVGFMQKS